jgi:hypothetical protein
VIAAIELQTTKMGDDVIVTKARIRLRRQGG